MAKGKKDFITGQLFKLIIDDVGYTLWVKNDAMIRVWIRNSISLEIQEAYTYAQSAKQQWDSLKDKYGQYNGILLSILD